MFFQDIQVGDTIQVHTAWGTGRLVEGIVVGKEKDGKNEQDVVDYQVEGSPYENWCYFWQIVNLTKKEESK